MPRAARPAPLPPDAIARHYHAAPYAALVLSGGYEEAGDGGRFRVAPGDVLIHGPFSAHQDRIGGVPTRVLDLPLPFDGRSWIGFGAVADADAIVRLAERDVHEAARLLVATLMPRSPREGDLPDLLAAALTADPGLAIAPWAERHGYSRETVSRQFRRAYGIDAAAYRLEARARAAWRRIVATADPLADVAAATGFADQAHMTRAIVRLTGSTPARWRRPLAPVTFVQEDRAAAR